jgi:hypothetical protein
MVGLLYSQNPYLGLSESARIAFPQFSYRTPFELFRNPSVCLNNDIKCPFPTPATASVAFLQ